jgi:hypothetical protein
VDAGQIGASGEGGLAASDGLGHADPPAGHCADSARGSAARGRLGLTRRAVLSAVIAVPVVAGVGSSSSACASSADLPSPQPSPLKGEGAWISALAAYRKAKEAQDRFDLTTREATAGPRGRSFAEQRKMDDRFGDYLVATCNAVRRLMRTPAPDLEALGLKIALIVDQRGWELTGGERGMAVLKADARRLCGR